MKKLFLFMLAAMVSVSAIAQEKAKGKADMAPGHQCYMMKEGKLMHCMGDKADAQKENVTLKNGTVITTDGEVKMKDGKSEKLNDGQCISLAGKIGDCKEMHDMKKDHMEHMDKDQMEKEHMDKK